MSGFSVFDKYHLLWLAICVVLTVAVLILFKKCDRKNQKRVIFWVLVFSVFMHFYESFGRYIEGTYSLDTIPLHICAISTYLMMVHYFWPHPAIGEILFTPSIPGALAALLFPSWTKYPPFSRLSWTAFFAHLGIILYIVLCIQYGMIRPSLKNVKWPLCFMAVYAAVMIPFDKHFGVNFGFLNTPSPGSPLMFIAKVFGTGAGYYIGYAILVVILLFVCYGIHALLTRRSRKAS